MHELLELWRLWMLSAHHSGRTIGARLGTVDLFERRTGADPVTCDWRAVARFLTDPRLERRSSQQTYAAQLRAWFTWLVGQNVRADNPFDQLPKMKAVRGVPRPVTTDELGRALAAGRFYRRTRTMILLETYQGLRAAEIARFRGEQIRGGQLWVTGKGGVRAAVPLHPLVAEEARRYPDIGWWFPSPTRPGEPITSQNVSRVIGQALRRAGVDAVAHQLRHWYGTQVLRASGGNIRVAQKLLRHASPATTAIYTLIEDEELTAAVAALPVPLHSIAVRESGRRSRSPKNVDSCGEAAAADREPAAPGTPGALRRIDSPAWGKAGDASPT